MMDLSLIIPAFNEQELITSSLEAMAGYLQDHFGSSEIIVVDDGSTDETWAILNAFSKKDFGSISLKALSNLNNQGKGFSVRRGMLAAQGHIRIFMDADMPFDLQAIGEISTLINSGADIVIGDRNHENTSHATISKMRAIAGRIYSSLIQLVIHGGISDTQCGLKGFSATAADLVFKRTTIEGFGFDVEVLFVAQKHKLEIARIPVIMNENRVESRVQILKDSLKMLLDLGRIRWRGFKGIYD